MICGSNCMPPKPPELRKQHGWSKTREYAAWSNMLQRCIRPDTPGFENYGGRGISVCRRWYDFRNFIADMGPRPSHKHSLERKNVNGNYQKSNCCWATSHTQHRNKRDNVFLTAFGKTQCLKDWSREIGLSPMAIQRRISVLGWSVKEALTLGPYAKEGRLVTYKGVTLNLHGWSNKLGITFGTLCKRLYAGRPIEEVLGKNSLKDTVLKIHGREQSLKGWSREFGIPYSRLLYRIGRGIPVGELFSLVDRRTIKKGKHK